MTRRLAPKLALALALGALAPAVAVAAPPPAAPAVPVQLDADWRAHYRAVFTALDRDDFAAALALLDARPRGLLDAYARAAVFAAKGSPRLEGPALAYLVNAAPDLPQAPALARLAELRGAQAVATVPYPQELRWLGASPRRARMSSQLSSPLLDDAIAPLLREDRPMEAEAALDSFILSGQAASDLLVEWRQRIAWSYYQVGDNRAAHRLGTLAASGGGPFAAMGDWVAALAHWRMGNFAAAADTFQRVSQRSDDSEMVAAAHFWAARSEQAAARPERVQPHLAAAARLAETFYGMLAQSSLGLRPVRNDPQLAVRPVLARSNVRIALALAEIGQRDRADQLLRWQARIGPPVEHGGLTALAGRIGLPATQYYLAHNGPAGARVTAEARYPEPQDWVPQGGWRVDRALVFAHALQESNFRTSVVSKAGAVGLMQVLPGTAQEVARRTGLAVSSLQEPQVNMALGQGYIEQLSQNASTGGLLPKVIAAYNAGSLPVERWNARLGPAARDPLLYIESISYWETRGYVATVLRNYWMYQQNAGRPTPTRDALAQGRWPSLPREQ